VSAESFPGRCSMLRLMRRVLSSYSLCTIFGTIDHWRNLNLPQMKY
jgi:hypothetical protein